MRMLIRIAIIAAVAFVASVASQAAVTNTSRGKLSQTAGNRDVPTIAADSIAAAEIHDSISGFSSRSLTFSGFKKRAGDVRESFLVKNLSKYHITQIKLLMRYTDMGGRVIHERTVVVPCDVMPSQTHRVTVHSFDQERRYYYRYGGKPRLKAVPFDVAVRLLRYDVAIDAAAGSESGVSAK